MIRKIIIGVFTLGLFASILGFLLFVLFAWFPLESTASSKTVRLVGAAMGICKLGGGCVALGIVGGVYQFFSQHFALRRGAADR